MAYTYEDFTKAANTAGMLKDFTEDDLLIAKKNPEYGLSLLSIMKEGAGATTAEQKLLATETANKLRKAYSGVGNTGYIGSYTTQKAEAADKALNYGPASYSKDNEYQEAMKAVTDYGPFSYDPDNDPSYSAMKKAYLREGERAAANAMALAAAATGGVPSSYAVSAATQAGNNYAGKLADSIPTLEQNAYQKYLNEFDKLKAVLATLEDDRAKEFEDWATGYNMLLDKLNTLTDLDQTEYQRYLAKQEMDAAAEAARLEREAVQAAMNAAQNKQQQSTEVEGQVGDTPMADDLVISLPGHGKLSDTGRTTPAEGTTGRSNRGLREVPLYLAEDGTLWYLDPKTKLYIQSTDYGIDYNSILALGYGDMDAEKLDRLIRSGVVKEVLENGVYKYKRVYGGFHGGGGGYKSIEDRLTT